MIIHDVGAHLLFGPGLLRALPSGGRIVEILPCATVGLFPALLHVKLLTSVMSVPVWVAASTARLQEKRYSSRGGRAHRSPSHHSSQCCSSSMRLCACFAGNSGRTDTVQRCVSTCRSIPGEVHNLADHLLEGCGDA